MGKDYYNILGIEKNASEDDIKKAFRKKAHKYHPDKEGGDEEKFKEINEAYQVLKDKQKRAQYDQFGSESFQGGGGFGGGQGFGGFGGFQGFQGQAGGFEDLGDMFGDIFGFGGRGRGGRKANRGKDIQVDVDLTFEESVFGAEKEITLTKPVACERCGGTGGEPGTNMKTCGECDGQGVRVTVQRTILGNVQSKQTCSACQGQGETPEKNCGTCAGSGLENKKRTLTVRIPSGVEGGNVLRVRGEGEAIKGGQPGDLFVHVHVKKDKRFERRGATIISEKKIGFTQAALGSTVEVETVDGKVDLKIPSGTQSGSQFRLRGKGVQIRNQRGDQIVVVTVVTPKKLSRSQKKLMEELGLEE